MAKVLKCSPDGMCVGMKRVRDDSCIRTHVIYNKNTWTPVKWMVAIHAGEHKKSGVVMNFCPFCGQKLGVMEHTEKRKKINAALKKKSAKARVESE